MTRCSICQALRKGQWLSSMAGDNNISKSCNDLDGSSGAAIGPIASGLEGAGSVSERVL